MVKQGQFAKANRVKQLKNWRVKHQPQNQRTINEDQFTDFLLGRYVLTSRKHLSAHARETGQRFLQELAPRLLESNGDEKEAVFAVLQFALGRVPWQFYWQIDQAWDELARFLKREVPAVPLPKKMLLKNLLSQADLSAMMIELLSRQAAAATAINQASSVTQVLAGRLAPVLRKQQGIDWGKVRQLIGPLPFNAEDASDEGTKAWLIQLQKL